MKKILALLALATVVGFVSCNKEDPTPKAEQAYITAADITVEAGKTEQIVASTNSTAPMTYVADNSGVASVDANGLVTGIKEGTCEISIRVAAIEGVFTAAEKKINVTVTPGEQVSASITIDGEFSDWSSLDASKYKKAKNDPDSPWEGVEEIRCYANAQTVFYYIKFDAASLEEAFEMEPSDMHLRLCINTDGEYKSGYTSYFLEGYDFIIEGGFADEGTFIDFDAEFHQRVNGSWKSLLAPENGLVSGKGNGIEYEIALDRATFNAAAATSPVPMPMGDEFQTGIRFYYNGWQEFSNMPNSSVNEEAGNGYGYLMRIKTDK